MSENPLLKRSIRSIPDRRTWLRRWNAVNTVEELKGLLDVGLQVPESELCAQIMYYLDLSDIQSLVTQPGGEKYVSCVKRDVELTELGMRQLLAEKAKAVLERDYFAKQPPVYEESSRHIIFYDHGMGLGGSAWSPVEYSHDGVLLFKRLVELFSKHRPMNEGVELEFYMRFVNWILDKASAESNLARSCEDEGVRTVLKEALVASIPVAVDMLHWSQFQFSGRHGGYRNLLKCKSDVQVTALPRLHDRALGKMHRGHSTYKTLNEAFLAGSAAAEVCIVLERRLTLQNKIPS